MSATGRGTERVRNDQYNTPAWCVRRLLEGFNLEGDHGRDLVGGGAPGSRPMRLLEPCAGEGAIVREVTLWLGLGRGILHDWTAVEIDPSKKPTADRAIVGDYLEVAPTLGTFDAVVTNPPYELAFDFLARALEQASVIVMLLRLGFLASEDRASFMRQRAPDVYVLPNRPRFDPSIRWNVKRKRWARSTADSADYAWMVFGREQSRGTNQVLSTTPVEDRAREFDAACRAWDAAHPEIVAAFEEQKRRKKDEPDETEEAA